MKFTANFRSIVLITFLLLANGMAYGGSKKLKGVTIMPLTQQNVIIAEATGVKITVDDMLFAFESLNDDLKKTVQTIEGRKSLVETMLLRELIYQQACKDGLHKTETIKRKIKDSEKKIIVEAYLKKNVAGKADLSDSKLKEYYKQNVDQYVTNAQFRISHILLKDEDAAKDILTKINEGESFKLLAVKYSTDKAAAKGGDLGWFSEGDFIPEIEEAAFELELGEVTDVVETKFGYHVIKLTGKRPAGQRSFAEVKMQINEQLKPIAEGELFARFKENVIKNNKLKYKDDLIDNIEFYPTKSDD